MVATVLTWLITKLLIQSTFIHGMVKLNKKYLREQTF